MKRRSFLRLTAAASITTPVIAQELKDASSLVESGSSPMTLTTVLGKARVDDRDWRHFAIRPLSKYPHLLDANITSPIAFSEYGGNNSRKFRASGFFRLEKAPDRWWLVDPKGCAFLSAGVNSVAPGGSSATQQAFEKHFREGAKAWADAELPKLRSWGFNTAGCWSKDRVLRQSEIKIAYMTSGWPGWERSFGPLETFMRLRGIGFDQTKQLFIGGIWPVFGREFADFVEGEAKRLSELKEDRWMLGRFLDNELTLPDIEQYLIYQGTDPLMLSSRNAALEWLKARHPGESEPQIAEADKNDWPGYVYERYLSIVVPVVRREDPNHLIFGPRLHGKSLRNQGVVTAIARWCDVLCANPYGQWAAPGAMLEAWAKKTGKPVLISEFYAKAEDASLDNGSGVGFLLKTQNDRGLYYQNYVLAALRQPSVIGWHWHRYRDHHINGRASNKGLVDLNFKPYSAAVDMMSQMNQVIYQSAAYLRKMPGEV